MATRIYASFLIQKFGCDPSEVTKIVGVAPTVSWLEGDIKPKTALRYRANGWKLSSALPVSAGIAEHVSGLLEQIYPRAKNLPQLGEMSVTISVAIYLDGDDRPEGHLGRELVSKLAELGAAIDIDLYTS